MSWDQPEYESEPCSGVGQCHGPLKWCNACGDVGAVCNYELCDAHHCETCGKLAKLSDRTCEPCESDAHRELLRHDIEREVAAFEAALDDGETERADFLAARVLRLRRELAEVRP